MADIDLVEQYAVSREFSYTHHPFDKDNAFVQFVVMCSKKDVQKGMRAVKQGAAGYLQYPVQEKDVQLLISSTDKALYRDFELDYLRDYFWKTEWLDIIQSKNPGMKKIFESIRSVSPTIATVLIPCRC